MITTLSHIAPGVSDDIRRLVQYRDAAKDRRSKHRIEQFMTRVCGVKKFIKVSLRLRHAIKGVLRCYRVDENLQFPDKIRTYVTRDGWIEAKAHTINTLWGISDDQRQRALKELQAMGLVELRTITHRNSKANFYKTSQFRLCAEKVAEILPLTGQKMDEEIAVVEEEKTPVKTDETDSSCCRNIATTIVTKEPVVPAPLGAAASASVTELEKTRTGGAGVSVLLQRKNRRS